MPCCVRVSSRFSLRFALLLIACNTAYAATFNIANGDVAGLKSAITTANTNGADDTINLAANGVYVLTVEDTPSIGLPMIQPDSSHALTINGASATIRRSTAGGTTNFLILFISVGAQVTLDRLTIMNGRLTTGTGAGISNSGNLTLTKCIVTGNAIAGGGESAGAAGGGIATFPGSTLVVTDSDISFNTASGVQSGRGGGISSRGTLTVTRCTFTGNFVFSSGIGSGGAIRASGPTTIINSTISGNSATGPGNGGGIFHQPLSMSDTLLLVNSTIAENVTDAGGEGGGIYSFSAAGNETLLLRNTIVATNTSNSGPDVLAGAVTSQGHNFVGKTDGSSGWNATDLTGTIAMPRNPMLASLNDNGGMGLTHALLNTSLAINAGDDAVLGAPLNLTTDQRLAPRRLGSAVDIGAFEFDVAQPGLVVNTIDEHDDGLCGIGDCTLQEALNIANSNPDASTITFAAGLTGVLTNQDFGFGLVISTPVTIAGPGARLLTISGGLTARIFSVQTGPTTISGLTLANGRPGASGAAILNAANLTLNNCLFNNNTTPASGGAILNGGPLVINNCTFTANVADTGTGGAIHNLADASSQGNLTVINSTFYNNLAYRGGALSNIGTATSPGISLLRNCTISGNAARFNGTNQGGGLINLASGSGSIVRLENTIVAGNSSDDVDPDVSGTFTSGGYNLIGLRGNSTGLTNGVNNDQVGSGAFPVNPQLGPLQDNGGPTDTRALLPASTAINAANNATAPSTDQRGYGRTGTSDIGAYEFNGVPPPIDIDGSLRYCSNPIPGPVPNVMLSLTGSSSGSTLSDVSGNYAFLSLPGGGSYTVTPTKAARAPGSAGITGVDAVATQRHFLKFGTPLTGCRVAAADVTGNSVVDGVDAVAIQRFFLGVTSGIANTGKYQFFPENRSYSGVVSNQAAQNYDTLVFGDVASSFVERVDDPSQTAAGDGTSVSSLSGPNTSADQVPAPVAVVALPKINVDSSVTNFIAAVTTSAIDAKNTLVGFQGEFTFDERVVTFESDPVQKAGLTSGNWNVSGNVLPGAGPIRTLRISAYSNDFIPLSGSGALFELRMTRVSKAAQSTQLLWASQADQFIFIDADLNTQTPGYAASGSVTASGKRR